ncbi:MAG TPA: HdeD family acid-resistance protein [Ktedonobacterales bacterium]|nr:HdeD family acid-resistance protein [Ktedonobacterales bacterium]
MSKILTRSWWALALGGIAAVLFGIFAFRWPGLTLAILVTLFGAYALVDGIFAIITAIEGMAHHRDWIWPLVIGAAGVATGIITFVWPSITAVALLVIIAAWAIVTGGLQLYAAIQLRREITNEWLLIVAGGLSVLFGLLLIVQPGAGALAVIWLIGSYAIIAGVLRLGLAFRLRSLQHQLAPVLPRG